MLEIKSIAALAGNKEVETPRKRKRETCKTATTTTTETLPPLNKQDAAAADAAVPLSASCFSNAAFSSTPKTLVVARRRRCPQSSKKENEQINPFVDQPGLEFKSIPVEAKPLANLNPFEVQRQPSKRKKREHACFENAALNLELPERQFNPYEVVRSLATPPAKGFVNQALNLRGNDAPASLNPFEIHRRSDISAAASNPVGVANEALSEEPTSLKIGLPFAPTLGYRIDFNGMELAHLTPSKLFAEKLVFSPVPKVEEKRVLGAISEEQESTMDIGKELDRYQLELENSINEAKLRKNGIVTEKETEKTPQSIVVCSERLTDLKEFVVVEQRRSLRLETLAEVREISATVEEQAEDVAYASESEPEETEDELDFKAPARFVRAYRPAAAIAPNVAGSKESLQSIASSKSSKSTESSHGVRQMIRKSIRKLMHPMQHQQQQHHNEELQQPQHGNNIISSIRHSLRRRPQKQPPVEETSRPADISIVDSSERRLKLRSNVPQTEYMRIEQLTNEKKHTLRNSLRRSTRDVLRHVFHKSQQDAYATAK